MPKGYALHSTSGRATMARYGRVAYLQSLLNQSKEEFPPRARVVPGETKGEFIKVVVEVLTADRALVGPKDQALEKLCNPMDTWL